MALDQKRANDAQGWIETVLGQKLQGDFVEAIKDGVVLCDTLNKIWPGSCKKYKKSKVAFVCRTNIQIYLQACEKLGLKQVDRFESRDLFDGQRPNAVVDNIFALSAVSRDVQSFNGPYIGVAKHKANKREFSQAVLNKSKSAVPMWNRGDKEHKTKNMDGYGIVKTDKSMQKHTGAQSTWEKGSIQRDTSAQHDSYGIVSVQGTDKHSGVQSSWEKGSLQTDTSAQHDSYGIVSVQGTDKHTGAQSAWEKGSLETDTASKHDSYGIVSVQGTDKHTGAQSNWEKGSLETDKGSKHDSYGVVRQPDHMQK